MFSSITEVGELCVRWSLIVRDDHVTNKFRAPPLESSELRHMIIMIIDEKPQGSSREPLSLPMSHTLIDHRMRILWGCSNRKPPCPLPSRGGAEGRVDEVGMSITLNVYRALTSLVLSASPLGLRTTHPSQGIKSAILNSQTLAVYIPLNSSSWPSCDNLVPKAALYTTFFINEDIQISGVHRRTPSGWIRRVTSTALSPWLT